MKVFLDANVLISVLNKEYPLFTFSSRILSLTDNSKYQLFTSPLCLAIAFYFSTKKSGEILAKKKIDLLSKHMALTTVDEKVTKDTLKNKQIHDFEDGLEYYSALKHSCDVIITENKADFYFSSIEVLGCEEFIVKYF